MKRIAVNPVLLLAGAVVIIDLVCEEAITTVFRRNRGELVPAGIWFIVHVWKRERKHCEAAT